MNKQFHQFAPILALQQMPEDFRAFFISGDYTEKQLSIDADLPDMVDHDNILINAEIHHAHSFKLEERDGKLRWVDGDCLGRLKGLCADAHDFRAEGRLDDLRYTLAKMTHYRVDALTYPHLHRGKPWSTYHERFETEMGAYLTKNHYKIGPLSFEPYSDIYKVARKMAFAAWYEGLDVVRGYEQGKPLTEKQKLTICRQCIKGIGSLWMTLYRELKLSEVGQVGKDGR